ncbi:MAG TPA: class I SAM-dependent methyltransferase [Puia sp.]|jgi:SAM-dependent methyltransferase|nr:class I SAM-dependent methyltransferase [Puia sp.]
MGSQAAQAQLWGKAPLDWSNIQEPTGRAGYDHALNILNPSGQESLLDIGCGSGLFCSLAAPKARFITGLDATVELVEEARRRLPAYPFLVGEMEALPFPDEAYDIVTGFNSFQYAATIANAFAEARRVLQPGGRLVVMVWGNKADCEAASFLAAVGSLLPPPPPGAPGPFALSENQLLERSLEAAGFAIKQNTDVPSVWDYPDTATALRGLLSAGPSTKAVANSGYDKVVSTLTPTFAPFTRPNGHIVYQNKFRVVLATKSK